MSRACRLKCLVSTRRDTTTQPLRMQVTPMHYTRKIHEQARNKRKKGSVRDSCKWRKRCNSQNRTQASGVCRLFMRRVRCVDWKPSFMHNGWRAPAAAVCKSVPRTWADKTHAHTVTASQAQAFTESHLHKTVPRSCLSVAITCPSGAVFEKCVEKNLHISWFAVNLRRCTNVFPLSEVAYTSWLRRSVIPR